MEAETTNLPEIDALRSLDTDEVERFVEESLDEVTNHLQENREYARDAEESVEDVLANSNIDKVQVRAKPFENPRITVWLKDCPLWANDAWTDTIYPNGINAYNGKVTTTFDVRPF